MSKAIYICTKKRMDVEKHEQKLKKICTVLTPDNIDSKSNHKIFTDNHIAYAVTLDTGLSKYRESSLLLGLLFESESINWEKPKESYPDGNFAIFRASKDVLEVISDVLATRTIWCYHDDETFIASTSQRAIILYLGSFNFNKKVIPWMLSTGALGPEESWDKRINRLEPNSSILLDKKKWTLSYKSNTIEFSEKKRSKKQHKEQLSEAIRNTLKHLETLSLNNWLLPLSGGYDSRGLLCLIQKEFDIEKNLETVTWGDKESRTEKGNDAKIAKDLAETLGFKNRYYYTDVADEPLENIIDRFLLCSEGRTDRIAGYTDGMKIWRSFYQNKITGVIRGDEAFGYTPVSSELDVKLLLECATCADFKNLEHIITDFNFPTQELPERLKRKKEETLELWRDRLYQSYRTPTKLAAMSDVKLSYVELFSPFLSKSILSVVRTLPDDLRTNKKLFVEIVDAISPAFPIAEKGANSNLKSVLSSNLMLDIFRNEIESEHAKNLLGKEFTDFILNEITDDHTDSIKMKGFIKSLLNKLLPSYTKKWLRKKVLTPKIDNEILAFRVFIIIKMHKVLTRDASKLLSKT